MHQTSMIALDTLQHSASHTLQILHKNGFETVGPNAQPEIVAAAQDLYKAIDRLKQIVLLDGYDQGNVTVAAS